MSDTFLRKYAQRKIEKMSRFPRGTKVRRNNTEDSWTGKVVKHWYLYGTRYVTFQINEQGDVDWAKEDNLVVVE